jgi:hypothetical protein
VHVRREEGRDEISTGKVPERERRVGGRGGSQSRTSEWIAREVREGGRGGRDIGLLPRQSEREVNEGGKEMKGTLGDTTQRTLNSRR